MSQEPELCWGYFRCQKKPVFIEKGSFAFGVVKRFATEKECLDFIEKLNQNEK